MPNNSLNENNLPTSSGFPDTSKHSNPGSQLRKISASTEEKLAKFRTPDTESLDDLTGGTTRPRNLNPQGLTSS